MEIKVKTVYTYKGDYYISLAAIKARVENQLGYVVDSFDATLTPKQKLAIFNGLVKNKDSIAELLNITVDISDDELCTNTMNILDH